MRRKAEAIIGMIGGVLSIIIFGGFSATMLSTDRDVFEQTLFPLLPDVERFSGVDEAYELMTQFSNWMGIFLFLMAASLAAATVLIIKNKKPKLAGSFYAVSGICLLIGTQGLGFMFAFLLFTSALLSFIRKHLSNEPESVTQS
ncbi:DUF4064 domain-containing protein [Marinilactibacillus sp. XAAS-LB27]|uniref:DUF4064 domain-containing protein n=1 Tax=Marinilactibacillus sp. XAAS-LB27 TaxID=3114538 RepID=UPI002E199D35|nr:DUF4064 domain-containing protein [Marinilactibacillus sp. XAAS-LB27]